jgi:cell shape-determining protein MreD
VLCSGERLEWDTRFCKALEIIAVFLVLVGCAYYVKALLGKIAPELRSNYFLAELLHILLLSEIMSENGPKNANSDRQKEPLE